MPIGFTLPFSAATGSLGLFEMTTSELDALRQNIKSLLVTNWGERPMHYTFGCNFREFIFENKTGDLKESIADRILSQFEQWMPFLLISNLNVLFSEDDETLNENAVAVLISYALKSKPGVGTKTKFIIM